MASADGRYGGAAAIAKGDVVLIDRSLIRADVSWDAIAQRPAPAVEAATGPAAAADGGGAASKPAAATATQSSVCTTDPDAALTKNHQAHRSAPSYKHHAAVDAERGVVLDVAVTTGAVHDTKHVEDQLTAVATATGSAIRTATLDARYAITRVFADLEGRAITAVIPVSAERPPKTGTIPVRRVKLDAKNRLVRCPAGTILHPHGKPDSDGVQHARARIPDRRAGRSAGPCSTPPRHAGYAVGYRHPLVRLQLPSLRPDLPSAERRAQALSRRPRSSTGAVRWSAASWTARARCYARRVGKAHSTSGAHRASQPIIERLTAGRKSTSIRIVISEARYRSRLDLG